MVDLFADVPEEITQNTLQTIRRNLDQVGLYKGGVRCRFGMKTAAITAY